MIKESYKPLTDKEIANKSKSIIDLVKNYAKSDASNVRVDLEAVHDMVVRIDKRKHYFYYFHNKQIMNEIKETALICYWIIKLKPFYVESNKEGYTFNEKFCTFIYLDYMKDILHTQNKQQKADMLESIGHEFIYTLRFRELSQEAMISLFDVFYKYNIIKKGATI